MATRSLLPTLTLALLLLAPLCRGSAGAPSPEALELRNLGIAELENEQPAKAEALFRRLIEVEAGDPLGYANLAISTLRQQKYAEAEEWIAKAKGQAPGDPALTAIEAEIKQWSGRPQEALDLYRKAASAAVNDVLLQYAYYRQAMTLGPAGEEDGSQALARLGRLRPDNLVVFLMLGQQGIKQGDRAAASASFLRLRELVWQAPAAADTLIQQILAALEAGDLEAARVPALRLENVLKITPMYRESLRELSFGIQGQPLYLFRSEPDAGTFGPPLEIGFRASPLAPGQAAGGLVAGDFDGDGVPDLAWSAAEGPSAMEVRLSPPGAQPVRYTSPPLLGLLAADLDNDGRLDLIGWNREQFKAWKGLEGGAFEEITATLGVSASGLTAASVIDFDIEGDLDLALGGSGGVDLYRNSLTGSLDPVGDRSLPPLGELSIRDLLASDLDRDGDLDLLLAHETGLIWLDNLRHGKFEDRTAASGLDSAPTGRAVVSADLDNDGWPDLALAGRGLTLLHNEQGTFRAWAPPGGLAAGATFHDVEALDADNDGRLDLALAGQVGVVLLAQRPGPRFEPLPVAGSPLGALSLVAADFDRDGDQDLASAGVLGLHRLENQGGNKNRWLTVRLQGLDKGNSKNNFFGVGSTLEVRAGAAYQFREAAGDETHLGMGTLRQPDLLRVVWTNGVPQNRLAPDAGERIVEEQILKGSCPFLYAWDGEKVAFVTDLLWGAPAGLPVAPGVYAAADPEELVKVEGATARQGTYDLRVTEELWEAAFFDYVRLWVVDHPVEVEVASSLRILPGETIEEAVLGTRDLRPVAGAWDGLGREVTGRLARRDEIYADGWEAGPYQGVAARPWSFTLDLGEAPGGAVRLHLDGWIFPSDASLNLAMAQRSDLQLVEPRLEVETEGGWEVLMPRMGFPAGKTKTMVVDTPPLPPGARRLRIVTSQWLSWDRIAWSTRPDDESPMVRSRLEPARADLAFRGFSEPLRRAPNAPHAFDYSQVSRQSPWLPFPGRYTRYGDVRELLTEADDRMVIMGPGDEMTLLFDAAALPPPAPGWTRTVFLESHGWDKDADRNTGAGEQVEPLPFRAMTAYPYGPDESFPDTPLHREYREEWLTRAVDPPRPPAR